jgi:hypothetical protein
MITENPQSVNTQNGNLEFSVADQFDNGINNNPAPQVTTSNPVINDNGDLVGADGNVIYTKDQLAEQLKNKQNTNNNPDPNVDNAEGGENYSVDANGNLLKDGVLFKEKGKFTINEDNTIELDQSDAIINEIVEKVKLEGYNLVDDNGQPLSFEDTPDGFVSLANAIAAETYKNELQTFFNNFPVVADIVKHISNGGDVTNFLSSYSNLKDYSKLEIKPEDTIGKKEVIKDYLTKVAKNPSDMVDYIMKAIEASGDVDARFETSLNGLKEWQLKEEQNKQLELQRQKDENDRKVREHWEGVNTIIKKGTLGEFTLPEKDKDAFYKFIAHRADNDGNTAATIKYRSLSQEQKLMFDYLIYKDFNLEDVVKLKVAHAQAQTLKDKKVKKLTLGSKPTITKVGSDVGDLNIGSLS